MGRGPSLEVGITRGRSDRRRKLISMPSTKSVTNLPTVDLLVSLAYSAAVGSVLEDPLPVNLGCV